MIFDSQSEAKKRLENKKKHIDMVTRLYVSVIKSEHEISTKEVGILYSLLTNLFRYVDVSWEVYVRQIIDSSYDEAAVVDYLNTNLSQLDKIRIMLSLVIMAKTDNDFELSEITNILELSKTLNIDADGFMDLINYFELESKDLISLQYGQSISTFESSLFSDYVKFGKDPSCDIKYRNAKLSGVELFLFSIDTFLFVGTGVNPNAHINDMSLKANSIYLLPKESILTLSAVEYTTNILWKIIHNQEEKDEIEFTKADYRFILKSLNNSFEITVNHGTVYFNSKQLQHNRPYQVLHDDILQIRGYAPFQLLDVIRERSRIGATNIIPNELYINSEGSHYIMSKTETSNSIALIELKDGKQYLYPPKRTCQIHVNGVLLEEISPIALNTDIININHRNYRINSYYDLIEIPFELQQLSVLDIKHYFKDGQLALDSISFEANKGELIGVMGQSGSGKSTLLKTISSEIMPTYGDIQIDGKSLYNSINFYTQYFGYVPQDDLLYPYLTVYENLWYRGRLRMPNLSKQYLEQKIYNILHQVNLIHRKDTQVGDTKKKLLSGGERKRLNIALELLFEPTVIVCDEPTSGLSFNDTEQIIDILNTLSDQGKIVIITIHQPTSTIFKKFDKVMLMDMNGKQVYYGEPEQCFEYFEEELAQLTYRLDDILKKKDARTSDFMYEVISYPEYNNKNEVLYEQTNKMLQIKRKFPPEYWRDKFKRKMLYEIMQKDALATPNPVKAQRTKSRNMDLKAHLISMVSYIQRSFKMKMRNMTNTIITFVEAPLLALIVSFILRLSQEGKPYSYSQNTNIGIYVFVSVIAFIFLGLSNSIEEIYDERKIILREKMMNLKTSYYLISKFTALTVFSIIQVLLYIIVSSLVLGIRGVNSSSFSYFLMASMMGFSLGLLASSYIKDNKTIVNLLPLILIPQIIFGGAVIEFERMNRDITIVKSNPIPEVVQVIPSRWLFEGLATSYAKNTVFYRQLNRLEKKKLTYIDKLKDNTITREEFSDVLTALNKDKERVVTKWNPDIVNNEYLNSAVSMMDGRYLNSGRNVFLSSYKKVGSRVFRTWDYNMLILMLYLALFNVITMIKLKYLFKE